MLEQLSRLLGKRTGLLRLLPDIDLDQDLEPPLRPVLREKKLQPISKLDAVEGMNQIKDLERRPGLVPLQWTDEVPPRRGHRRLLCDGLLNTILSKVCGACNNGLAHDLGGEGLADRNQGDGGGIAATTLSSYRDAPLHFSQTTLHVGDHGSTVSCFDLIADQNLIDEENPVTVFAIDDLFGAPNPLLKVRPQSKVAQRTRTIDHFGNCGALF